MTHILSHLVDNRLDLQTLAGNFDADRVADVLDSMEFSNYAETFRNEDITGEVLLNADSEMFSELGVKSALHQMKISQLFIRELHGTTLKYSRSHLNQFLRKNNLEEHISTMEENGIDGDMILEVENELMENVLKEVGITSTEDITTICSKYKSFVSLYPTNTKSSITGSQLHYC